MLGSPILDLAIGMAFIYLLLSLIASVLQEILATITQARSANLERGLHSLFSGDPLELGPQGQPGTLFVEALYAHGLVRGLYQDPVHDSKGKEPKKPSRWELFQLAFRRKLRSFLRIDPPGPVERPDDLLLPAYIPSRTFALALTDLLNDGSHGWDSLRSIESHLRDLQRKNKVAMDAEKANPTPPGLLKSAAAYENKAVEALLALLIDAGSDADKFQTNLENWYNDSMDRASGWYKRYTQRILLFLGLGIAIFFNVDSIHVARTLWFDHDARQGLANAADSYIKTHPNFASVSKDVPAPSVAAGTDKTFNVDQLKSGLEGTVKTFDTVSQNSMLPIGWRRSSDAVPPPGAHWWQGLGRWILMFLGWCITAGALSLGAPFWFDTLNKIMVIRSTVKPSEKSPIEKSKA